MLFHPRTDIRVPTPWWGWTALAAGAWALALAVNRSLRVVDGSSMTPTLAAGQRVVVVPTRRPPRGAIAVVRDPRDPSRQMVKRVAAVGGDRLRRGGRVPPGHLWVVGDNPTASTGSETFGAVPRRLVVGRVVARAGRRAPRLSGSRPVGD